MLVRTAQEGNGPEEKLLPARSPLRESNPLSIRPVRRDWVFLNLPYDAAFERLYLAYIVGISAFRLVPHTTLEIPDTTRRLDRIQALMRECRYSIHDLSRVQLSRAAPRTPRFNMPFELGLAVSWASMNPRRHSWFVCDSVPHRVLRSMSDLGGTDINIHEGTVEGVMRELCNIFVRRSVRPDVSDLMMMYKAAKDALPRIQRKAGSRSVYEPRIFSDLCYVANDLVPRTNWK